MDAVINHFLGLRTAIYVSGDLQAARDWYAIVLGFPPYFDEPFMSAKTLGAKNLVSGPPTR